MTTYDAAYLLGFGLLMVFEVVSLIRHDGETISHKVTAWAKTKAWHRWLTVGGLLWLTYHWGFQHF